jgi:hypothetical protein
VPRSIRGYIFADAYATLQAAHDALPPTGGVIILSPNIVYSCASRLTISKPNVQIRGAGWASSVIRRAAAYTTTESWISVTAPATGFRLTDCTVDGNNVVTPGDANGTMLLYPDDVLIERCHMIGHRYIAFSVYASRQTFRDCTVTGVNSAGAASNLAWWGDTGTLHTDITVDNCVVTNHYLGGFFVANCLGAKILNSYWRNNNFATGGQIALSGPNNGPENLVMGNIIDCHDAAGISGLEFAGVTATGFGNVAAIGNEIYGGGVGAWGIALESGVRYRCVGNRIVGFAQSGIYAFNDGNGNITDIEILGNGIIGCAVAGIYLNTGCDDYVIVGNELSSNGAAITDLASGANRTILGNQPTSVANYIPNATTIVGATTLGSLGGVLKATAGVVAGSAVHGDLGEIGANNHHSQAHGASDHDNRTRLLWLPAGVFTAGAGSPALAAQGANTRYRAWALDAATLESVITELVMPSDYVAGAITAKVHWTNLGAGSGNVYWVVAAKNQAAASNLDSTTYTSGNDIVAAPAQDVLKTTTSALAFTPSAADALVVVRVTRLASDGNDTLANDAGFLGISLEYTADS